MHWGQRKRNWMLVGVVALTMLMGQTGQASEGIWIDRAELQAVRPKNVAPQWFSSPADTDKNRSKGAAPSRCIKRTRPATEVRRRPKNPLKRTLDKPFDVRFCFPHNVFRHIATELCTNTTREGLWYARLAG